MAVWEKDCPGCEGGERSGKCVELGLTFSAESCREKGGNTDVCFRSVHCAWLLQSCSGGQSYWRCFHFHGGQK